MELDSSFYFALFSTFILIILSYYVYGDRDEKNFYMDFNSTYIGWFAW